MARRSQAVTFPHPVVGLGDDVAGELRCNAPQLDFGVDNTTLSVDGFEMTNPTIAEFIRQEVAAFTVRVSCGATYYRESITSQGPSLQHILPSARLNGEVEIQVRVCARKKIDSYRPEGLHPDYGERTFVLQAGDVLALGDEFAVRADKQFDPLAADISSIMRVVCGAFDKGPFKVKFPSAQILIELSTEDYKRYGLASNTAPGVLHSALVLPVLAEAITYIRGPSAQDDEGALWYRRMKAMLEARRIDDDESALTAAQKLLDAPFSRALENIFQKREED